MLISTSGSVMSGVAFARLSSDENVACLQPPSCSLNGYIPQGVSPQNQQVPINLPMALAEKLYWKQHMIVLIV